MTKTPHYILCFCALLLVGCATRTVSPEQAAADQAQYEQDQAAWRAKGGEASKNAGGQPTAPESIPQPTFDASVDVVHSAVVSAFISRYGKVDRDDREKHVVEVSASAFQGSSTVTAATFERDGKAVVDIVSESGNSIGRTRNDVRDLVTRIRLEMSRVDTQQRAAASH